VAPDAVDTAPPAPPDEAAGGSGDLRVLFGLATFGGLVALTAVPAFVRARRRRRRMTAAAAGGPGAADAAWAELLAESADRGAPSPPTDTVRGAARRMAEEHDLDEPTRRALRIVVGVVEESWYGGTDPAPGALTGALGEVHTAITTGTPVGWSRGSCRPPWWTACCRGCVAARAPTSRRATTGPTPATTPR
jgi:hypothetical protein